MSITSQAIHYAVNFDKVKSHYVSVQLDLELKGKDFVDFKVPVWTPGSYKVREFSNAFENVKAGNLSVVRRDKNTWRIATKGQSKLSITYDVYCFVVSVRQSYADENYAFLHGTSAFGYVEGFEKEPIELEIKPYKGWGNVEVSLPQIKPKEYIFTAENYDLLADSPIALGNFETTSYVSSKVPHKVVMIGEGNYDLLKIQEDFKKISDIQVSMMGEHPSPQYIHFIYNVTSGGGGLEHLNSQTSMMNRWSYSNPSAYKGFLGLVAHEYFHLWNVKRIRPIQLGPFDYNREVYTDMLWIAEGITSYYDDKTLQKMGLYEDEEYLKIIAGQISRYENTPGKEVMSLAHSSTLAWVKSYLPNEESMNTSVSYYNKGMIAAVLLDLEIRANSEHSLDDVMQVLYNDFYKKKGRGFTHDEFISVCSKIAERDLQSFFNTVIFSTKAIDYNAVFSPFGLMLKDENADKNECWSGVISTHSGGKTTISNLYASSPAVEAGLSVNDEIISVNGWRVNETLESYDTKHKVGDVAEVLYARDGKIFTANVQYTKNPKVAMKLDIVNKNSLYTSWLAN